VVRGLPNTPAVAIVNVPIHADNWRALGVLQAAAASQSLMTCLFIYAHVTAPPQLPTTHGERSQLTARRNP